MPEQRQQITVNIAEIMDRVAKQSPAERSPVAVRMIRDRVRFVKEKETITLQIQEVQEQLDGLKDQSAKLDGKLEYVIHALVEDHMEQEQRKKEAEADAETKSAEAGETSDGSDQPKTEPKRAPKAKKAGKATAAKRKLRSKQESKTDEKPTPARASA